MHGKRNLLSRKALLSVAGSTLLFCSFATLTGCQVDIGGQTLPSSHYLEDDVQYFPPGPEFMLSNEAAAMEEYTRSQQGEQP